MTDPHPPAGGQLPESAVAPHAVAPPNAPVSDISAPVSESAPAYTGPPVSGPLSFTDPQPIGHWGAANVQQDDPSQGEVAAEPVEYALPADVESVFIALPEDPDLAEQRERTAGMLDRGVLVLGIAGLVLLGVALFSTIGGNASWLGWGAPIVLFALAALCFFLLQRMEAKPANSLEVPVALVEDLTEAIAARDELDMRGAQFLNDEDYAAMLVDVDHELELAGEAASQALAAEHAADEALAARLHAKAQAHAAEVLDIRDDIFDEWDELDDEFEDEYEYEDDEGEDEGEDAPRARVMEPPVRPQPTWEAVPIPEEDGAAVPPSDRRPTYSDQTQSTFTDEPPPVIRPEPSRDSDEGLLEGRGSSRQARIGSNEHIGRATLYRPSSADKSTGS